MKWSVIFLVKLLLYFEVWKRTFSPKMKCTRVFFSSHRKEWKSIAILTILLSCQISTSCSPTLQTVSPAVHFLQLLHSLEGWGCSKALEGKKHTNTWIGAKKIRVFFTVFVFAFQASHGDELTKTLQKLHHYRSATHLSWFLYMAG